MLNLFFTITFIAQIIITYEIIKYIKGLRGSVAELNASVNTVRPVMQKYLLIVKSKVNTALKFLNCFVSYVSDKKQECMDGKAKAVAIGKDVLSTALSIVTKIPFAQILSVVEVILKIRKLLRISK